MSTTQQEHSAYHSSPGLLLHREATTTSKRALGSLERQMPWGGMNLGLTIGLNFRPPQVAWNSPFCVVDLWTLASAASPVLCGSVTFGGEVLGVEEARAHRWILQY
jgi:hypothetical protein